MIPQELNEAIDNLTALKDNLVTYETEETISFQRTTYSRYRGIPSNSVWRVLLDESKTKWCIRDNNGFKAIDKSLNDEVIVAPIGMRELVLSKNKADRDLAKITLDQIANKKYGRNEEQS